MGRRLRRFGIALGLLAVVLGGALWWFLRPEEIPEQLEAHEDPAVLTIPGIGDQPTLDAALMKGKTTFFVFVGIQNWTGDEGRSLNRALNRWALPEDVQGFIVFDAEGLGFLAEKSEEYMRRFGNETRYPMYGDFAGAFRQVFKMPRGHHGFVVVGPDGEVKLRKSGGAQDEGELTEIRALLGANEPPPGPPVPEFALGPATKASCAEKPCAIVFLGQPVARGDIPGIDEGFEGEEDQEWAQMQRPAIRNVGSVLELELEDAAQGVVVGSLEDLEVPPGWVVVEDDPESRAAFDVEPGADVFLVLRDGTIAFRGEGVIPFYEMGRVSDVVGVEFDFED